MKENLVLLAELLATDDAFNLAFSSRGTDEEKYELAKTKFTSLTHEDFSEFLEKLQEAQEKELSPEELEQIAGGGLVNKLATAALLLTTVVLPTATQSVSASVPEFHKELTGEAKLSESWQYVNKQVKKTKKEAAATPFWLKYFRAVVNIINSIYENDNGFYQALKEIGLPHNDIQLCESKTNLIQKDTAKKVLQSLWKYVQPDGMFPSEEFKDENSSKCVNLIWQKLSKRVSEEDLENKKKFHNLAKESLNAIKNAAKELKNTEDNCWDCEKIFNENFRVNGNIEFRRKKTTYKLSKGRLNHILNGDFKESGYLKGGGHTAKAIKRLEDIMNAQLTALKTVADESNNQLWVDRWLNAFDDGNRQADSIHLQPESTEQNGVMHYKLKYAEFSGGDGEQAKTVFPKNWDSEKIMYAMSRCIQEGICLQKPLEVVGPAYAAVVDGVAVVVYINSDNTISSCYPLDVQPKSSFEGEFFDCEYETIIAAGKKEKQTFHLPVIK